MTVYRELRIIHSEITESEALEAVRLAADSGDWAGYVMKQGGPVAMREDHLFTLAKAWNDEPGRYGEPKGIVTFGVSHDIVTVQTKIHKWEIEFSPLNTGEHAVLGEASSAQSGRGPVGGAPASARQAGVPVSREENSEIYHRDLAPLEFCQ